MFVGGGVFWLVDCCLFGSRSLARRVLTSVGLELCWATSVDQSKQQSSFRKEKKRLVFGDIIRYNLTSDHVISYVVVSIHSTGKQ